MTAASSQPNHRRVSRPGAQRALGLAAVAALAGMLALAAPAAWSQAGTRLEKVELVPQPGEQVEVRLVLDGPPPAPVTFTIDNPARLAVDLPGTTLALDSRRIDVKTGGVDTIVAAEASGRTRLVFNLDRMQPYNVRTEGNTVFVTVGGGSGVAPAAPAATPAPASAPVAAVGAATIEKIDFRRSPDGGGRIIVQTTGGARTQASLKREGGRVVVDFPNTQLGADQARRYDVTDFATPVNSFDVTTTPTGARIVVAATGDYEQAAYQTDREYVLELKPVSKAAAAAAADAKKEYKGERLTLNFQDIETRAVLQLLAETSGQNIVVSDTVQGNVTLRLQNVPWDQALDIVLRTKGLDKRQEGNVIYVAPAEELAAREKQLLEARKQVTELSPVRTEYLQVNYAKASDLAALIRSQGKTSLLSERGSISIDERTNTLLLQDTAERLADIRRLVATLDIPVKQVLIEARIVIVNDDFTRELGVRFGGAAVFSHGGSDGMGFVGSGGLDREPGESGPLLDPSGALDQRGLVETPTVDDRYMVNLPVANPAGRIAMTLLDSDYLVDLEITAAENEGRGEVVSAPRVITANGKEAVIEQGQEIPYQESASSGATTTQFKKAVLSLKVTPQITPDDRIILDLTVSKDSVGAVVPSATGGFVPSIDTREITTQVLVNDGQTVVLGGILETERRDTTNKVPYLGDIPGLGVLFRNKSRTDNKDELLIFVTPKILREGADVY
ncbi:MAG TPA: type IV pilus secretin PilQ [Burkholderiales bacterium]|nr:type IV pilus secretin PilQ [Burkholderiales bacterium]